ncbi:MAG TPA: threonine--tRNA ligase [Candidatus Saccharimonadales bacterium]|nr:threonine--tRNA ligase [Candidatus Saccharimonadales bacterium]
MNNEKLNHLRHSAAHLFAAAVMELWPDTKITIGPAIENGFYYDADYGNIKLSEEDFPKIEQKMHELVKNWTGFERIEVSEKEARERFQNNPYKLELIDEIVGKGEPITLYKSGDFVDLCRGGHDLSPKDDLKHFKLMKLAGAYWRGEEKNKMLTRVYGTAFFTQKELEDYLWQMEEAKKRDHKKLGKELSLFTFSPVVGPGLPLFMPKGYKLRKRILDYLDSVKEEFGYQFVVTPHIARSELYKISKHWQKYDAMMPPLVVEDDEYTMKPMNCPHHFQIYLAEPKSYRDLPLRMGENAVVYRYEKSGEINGLFRVRALTQDDSHWFVPHELLGQEINHAIHLIERIYKDFGLPKFYARISVRDPKNPDKYIGNPKIWDFAEAELLNAVKEKNIPYAIGEGEAAFYGPKIDFMIKDSLGREWQLTTLQLDFNQPENFNLTYTASDGTQKRPAVLHIAVLGSVERFMAIILEHFGGNLPTWLAPIQVMLLPIADRHAEYAQKVAEMLKEEGIRVEVDNSPERLQAKIRNATLQKIPFMGIIGDKEIEGEALSIRKRSGEDLGSIGIKEFSTLLKEEIDKKIV